MSGNTRRVTSSIAVAGVAAALVAAGVVPSAEGAQPPPGQVTARDSSATAQAKPTRAPKNAVVSFTVGLKRSDSAAANLLAEVSDPTSSAYRQFPSRGAVRSQFGAKAKSLQALRDSAGEHGIKVALDRTGVFATVTGLAGAMGDWLGGPITVSQGVPPGSGLLLTEYQGPAKLPKPLRSKVREFVPFDMVAQRAPDDVSASALPPYEGTNGGTPISCLTEEADEYIYAYNQLRSAYGIDDLPASSKVAKATRVVVIAQGDGFSRAALKDSAECFDVSTASFARKRTQGLKTKLPVGDEGQLDVQVVQSVLPAGSHVDVVEQAGYDGRAYLSWSRAFRLQRQPDVITTSYGNCEQETNSKKMPGTSKPLTEAVLSRLGLIGTSVFSAAGDQGSSDCVENNGTGKGNKNLAVDYPGSSTFVTSVGGTRLIVDEANGRVGEWVWNSTAALPPVGPSLGGGGGGTSRWFERPWWQPKSVTRSTMRTVPDLAAHAATGPFWPLFMSGGANADFEPVGGTSAATPMTAASVGIIAAVQRTKGQPRLGPIQPWLYRMQQKHPKAFYDVVDGDNDVYDQGCCSAKSGYDKASGLGSPNFDMWLRKLPEAG